MGAAAFQNIQGARSSPTAARVSPPATSSAGPAVVVDISPAARALAKSRMAAPASSRMSVGTIQQVDAVQPKILKLPTSESVSDNLPLSGNKLMSEGREKLTKPTIHTSISRGEYPLGRWTDGPLEDRNAKRPGLSIERKAELARGARTLSARLQSGELVGEQWNDGSLSKLRSRRPGKATADRGEQARDSRTLVARLAKGEEPLEVRLGRHLVRPDGQANGA
ncbi:MAG: hypothetical protein CL927_21060 [Deltaproteobacteria bacterium]|nr:hypothetical protein [Deltaproteobacteria bacterium]HCH65014.1 hypothetical protein [Deltaproteobacteria bacterium]